MEIERKFLVNNIPDLLEYNHSNITQGYISYDPEIRIRKKTEKFYITKKGDGTTVREEIETEINEITYNILLNLVKGNLIEKTRYEIPLENGIIAELDIYHGLLNGLITVETEFASEEESNTFIVPTWFDKDITADKRYKNKNLAQCQNASELIYVCNLILRLTNKLS